MGAVRPVVVALTGNTLGFKRIGDMAQVGTENGGIPITVTRAVVRLWSLLSLPNRENDMETPIFWLISERAQAALKKAYYKDAGRELNIPADTSWKPTGEDIEQIMSEAPRHVRRVD